MLVIAQRGAGDRPAPVDIVDPLCCTIPVALKQGKYFLDAQEVSDLVLITIPFTGLPPKIGSMIFILTAENTIETMRLSKWRIVISVSDDVVESALELTLQKRNPL